MALQREWVISIENKLERGGEVELNKPWEKHCIYKVPNWMKDEQGSTTKDYNPSYVPELISVGPYHRGLAHLQHMEEHKWRVLNHMLKRGGQDIKLYLAAVKELEEQARACYEAPVGLTSNEFVEMLVLDGCFVLEFLRGKAKGYNNLDYGFDEDPVFDKDSISHVITVDMMKLENQIPILILEKLLKLQLNRAILGHGVPKLVMFVLTPNWVTIRAPMPGTELNNLRDAVSKEATEQPVVHCLDVFRRSLVYKPATSPCCLVSVWSKFKGITKQKLGSSVILDKFASCADLVQRKLGSSPIVEVEHVMGYCISDLREAGIEVRPRHKLPFCGINFKEYFGVLEIHPLKIHSATETVFRNLIAYEQCHMRYPGDMVITNYVAFMDNLIDTAADVAYLHKAGILVHYFGSDVEVAEMFNNLVKKVYVSKKTGGFHELYLQLNRYCGRRRNKWWASLQNDYLTNPWVIISIFAALLLFVLTAAQTFYTIYPYYKPRN